MGRSKSIQSITMATLLVFTVALITSCVSTSGAGTRSVEITLPSPGGFDSSEVLNHGGWSLDIPSGWQFARYPDSAADSEIFRGNDEKGSVVSLRPLLFGFPGQHEILVAQADEYVHSQWEDSYQSEVAWPTSESRGQLTVWSTETEQFTYMVMLETGSKGPDGNGAFEWRCNTRNISHSYNIID